MLDFLLCWLNSELLVIEFHAKLRDLILLHLETKILTYPSAASQPEPQEAQLPGRLFSPSDISKKLAHHFLLHFPIGMGSYDHHAKYQGVFMDLL